MNFKTTVLFVIVLGIKEEIEHHNLRDLPRTVYNIVLLRHNT